MSNPFNLTDEQINEIGKYMLSQTVEKSWGQYARDVLAQAERMAKENAEAAFTVDWDNVPVGYYFVASDDNGIIYAYARKPEVSVNEKGWHQNSGDYIRIGFCQAVADGKIDWRTTLTLLLPTHA